MADESDYGACIKAATKIVLKSGTMTDEPHVAAARKLLIAEFARWQNYDPEPEGEPQS